MSVFKKGVAGLLIGSMALSASAFAGGIFLDKKPESHELSAAEKRRLTIEFYEKFGSQKASPIRKSDNPWQAKKQRQAAQVQKVPWGECRDYALSKRNACYKQGRDAYYCERFYDARIAKCNQNF